MLEYPFERMAQEMLPILHFGHGLPPHLKVEPDAERAGRAAVPYPTPERYPQILKAVLEATFGKSNLKIIGSKTPGRWSAYQMGLMRTIYSDIRFIFCVRNPLNTIKSSLHRRDMTKEGLDNRHIGGVQAAVSEYRENMALLFSHAQRFPDASFVLGYEALLASPEKTLAALSDFLGVDINDESNLIAASGREPRMTDRELEYVKAELGAAIESWPRKRTVGLAADLIYDFADCLQAAVPGRDYLFSEEENDRSMLGTGWSLLESEGVWSDDFSSDLHFTVEKSGNARLSIDLNAYVPVPGAEMPVVLEWDGAPILRCTASGSNVFQLNVDLTPCEAGAHTLRFRFTGLQSPLERSLSSDYRRLGVCLRRLKISPL